MSKRTIDFQIPLTNKVLEVEDGIAYVLATVLPVILIIGTFALFGTYGLLLIGSLAGGYISVSYTHLTLPTMLPV